MTKTIGFLAGKFHPRHQKHIIDRMLSECDDYYVEPVIHVRLHTLMPVVGRLKPNDCLMLWDISLFANSLEAAAVLTAVHEHQASITLLSCGLSTKTPSGRFQYHMLAAMKEFQRRIDADGTLIHSGIEEITEV